MRLNFEKLRQMGFVVEEDRDGVNIIPQEVDNTLAHKMSKHLQQMELSDIERDTVIESAMNSINRILISKAIS